MTSTTLAKPIAAVRKGGTTANPAIRAAVFSSASDNWPTPQAFFDKVNAEFGFVLDACGSEQNKKAGAYYGLDHTDPDRRDGLAGDWSADGRRLGGPVWLNSPYGRGIGAWMAKAAETAAAGVTVVALVPARTDTVWFHTALDSGAQVRHIRGRLTFGDAKSSAPFPSLLLIFPAAQPAVTGAGSTHLVPSRPQGDVQDVLQASQRDQVQPALPSKQRLHGGPRQSRIPAQPRQAAALQGGPQVTRDLSGVPGGSRSVRQGRTVGETTRELLGRAAQPRAAAHHASHARADGAAAGGPGCSELQPTPCQVPGERGTLMSYRTFVRVPGLPALPRRLVSHRDGDV
jgi:phage N-6-adenine-methyltransferase